uniref:Uncharacterized protein n=1 Tax=Eutreptiella gymnastica TaxID=73025 RepID=A0A7S1J088_9EUGL|mmetsp:Transcript_56914/g.101570  ORF Transcript_56914/g.101570 Transcript_56914/m.101570 type:complete len:153 (+) Transcript_56914:132-590(+)
MKRGENRRHSACLDPSGPAFPCPPGNLRGASQRRVVHMHPPPPPYHLSSHVIQQLGEHCAPSSSSVTCVWGCYLSWSVAEGATRGGVLHKLSLADVCDICEIKQVVAPPVEQQIYLKRKWVNVTLSHSLMVSQMGEMTLGAMMILFQVHARD